MKTQDNRESDIDFGRPLGIESGFFNQQLPPSPLAAPRSGGMPRGAKIGIAAFAIALVASVSVVAIALTLDEEDPVEAAKWRTIRDVEAKLAVIKERIAAEASASAEATGGRSTESASAEATAGSSISKVDEVEPVKKPVKKPIKRPVEKPIEKPVEKPVVEKPVDPKPQDELDKLLNPDKKPSLPKTLTRDQVRAGMSKVAGAVKSCGQGQGGSLSTRITISGKGKVANVQILGAHAGTPTGSCAARYIRRASFPKFADPSLRVKYPFSL
jgi:hypothetical protein